MKYSYYPGCSGAHKSAARFYQESLLSVFKVLDVSCEELEDWNCCGATFYMSIDKLKAFALCARNLALAEQQMSGEASPDIDMITPCSACYLSLSKAQKTMEEYPDVKEKITFGLEQAGLKYSGRVKVRHPLDIIVNDVGIDAVKKKVVNPLSLMRVACYYGCLLIRPYAEFDDIHNPTSMERLFNALGADPIDDWPMKTHCCGGSLTGTIEEVGVRLNFNLLKDAKNRGAEVIVTICPFCQFNLECFQDKIKKKYEEEINIPVLSFTQLIGVALGISDEELGMQRLFVPFSKPEGGAYVSVT